ncbi:MAG TPA: hypothetical protein VGD54_18405 [Steroidobacteraceae bacterium]
MTKLLAALILALSGVATIAYVAPSSLWHGDGGDHHGHKGGGDFVMAPEIDSSSAISALTLLFGSVIVLRSRLTRTKR